MNRSNRILSRYEFSLTRELLSRSVQNNPASKWLLTLFIWIFVISRELQFVRPKPMKLYFWTLWRGEPPFSFFATRVGRSGELLHQKREEGGNKKQPRCPVN